MSKKIPSNLEERLKLPADDFADPENRRFMISSTDDLLKLHDRVASLENSLTIKRNALKIAVKNKVEIPNEVLTQWEAEVSQ